MKLVLAIIPDDGAHHIMDILNENGYYVTKLASTGGFLRMGNTALICGVEDEKVEDLVSLFEKKCKGRRQMSTVSTNMSGAEGYVPYPVEVTVGGATIFVLNVDEFKKL
ncbi:MAG: cyclic-di-AMP receptor [Defluviitaleaceae bacterium]|nr:cyclic-di-AMP receptor [Defluviitaleaceae bacterium]